MVTPPGPAAAGEAARASAQLPAPEHVRYVAYDFKAAAKRPGAGLLADIAPVLGRCLDATGVFLCAGAPPSPAARRAGPSDWVRPLSTRCCCGQARCDLLRRPLGRAGRRLASGAAQAGRAVWIQFSVRRAMCGLIRPLSAELRWVACDTCCSIVQWCMAWRRRPSIDACAAGAGAGDPERRAAHQLH